LQLLLTVSVVVNGKMKMKGLAASMPSVVFVVRPGSYDPHCGRTTALIRQSDLQLRHSSLSYQKSITPRHTIVSTTWLSLILTISTNTLNPVRPGTYCTVNCRKPKGPGKLAECARLPGSFSAGECKNYYEVG
jgi:hypothetical protein